MQVFGNVATDPVRKESKTTKKGYFELRLCESQRGVDADPTWYSVRIMKDIDPGLVKGDFVKVTGKLKTDFYLSREGKPTGTLLIIAFEASKIAKPVQGQEESQQANKREQIPVIAKASVPLPAADTVRTPSPAVQIKEPARQPNPMQTAAWAEW